MARAELVEKARAEYGITNGAAMSDEQLEAEIKAIDDQPKTDDHYVAPKKKAKPAAKPAPKKPAAKTASKTSKPSRTSRVRNALSRSKK